jgi:hypothetical protein
LAIHGTAQVPEKLGYKKRIEVVAPKLLAGTAPIIKMTNVIVRSTVMPSLMLY